MASAAFSGFQLVFVLWRQDGRHPQHRFFATGDCETGFTTSTLAVIAVLVAAAALRSPGWR
ncbi:hypothetical protein [Nocardia jiangxiensis]|uniref:Uncharacterized protein n=1 Tax=Nocardia jiangxiensis TaxID=282685 RepID=A0ABW6SB28_9NOCA|nr:hypothetical protein [Nocardia jiangxiensis]